MEFWDINLLHAIYTAFLLADFERKPDSTLVLKLHTTIRETRKLESIREKHLVERKKENLSKSRV
jgi:hypothetical protein